MSVMRAPNRRLVSERQRAVGEHGQPRRIGPAREEARPVDDLRLAGDDRRHQGGQLRGIEFEVRVLDRDNRPARVPQAEADRRALARVLARRGGSRTTSPRRRERVEHLPRAVARPVVDDDDLPGHGQVDRHQAIDHRRDRARFVEDRDEDREQFRGSHQDCARRSVRTAPARRFCQAVAPVPPRCARRLLLAGVRARDDLDRAGHDRVGAARAPAAESRAGPA